MVSKTRTFGTQETQGEKKWRKPNKYNIYSSCHIAKEIKRRWIKRIRDINCMARKRHINYYRIFQKKWLGSRTCW